MLLLSIVVRGTGTGTGGRSRSVHADRRTGSSACC